MIEGIQNTQWSKKVNFGNASPRHNFDLI